MHFALLLFASAPISWPFFFFSSRSPESWSEADVRRPSEQRSDAPPMRQAKIIIEIKRGSEHTKVCASRALVTIEITIVYGGLYGVAPLQMEVVLVVGVVVALARRRLLRPQNISLEHGAARSDIAVTCCTWRPLGITERQSFCLHQRTGHLQHEIESVTGTYAQEGSAIVRGERGCAMKFFLKSRLRVRMSTKTPTTYRRP